MPQLLLELFSEEIPARMQAQAARDLERMAREKLAAAGYLPEALKTFAGPRRLTLVAEGLPLAQADRNEERKGPKVAAPDAAIDGFLRSTGLTRDQLTERDGVYFAQFARKGRATPEIIAEIVPAIVRDFPWPKSMTWGTGDLRWVRPLQRILCTFAGEVVPFAVGGVAAGEFSQGHRFMGSKQPFRARTFEAYADGLQANRVVLDVEERKLRILEGARTLCFARGLELVEDPGLLDEVAGLAEWPTPILGDMDPSFLDLPPEVIRTSMRTHQKYFAVRTPGVEGLAPHFLVVANIEASDGGALIAAGNARVLSARLSDAKFFWDEDRRVRLEKRLERLEGVTFHAKLGTLRRRVERLEGLAEYIALVVRADVNLSKNAARLCKADLATAMVGEFPELQGIMGGYYAEVDEQSSEVVKAIREHYKPIGPGDSVPDAQISIVVALADKLQLVADFWAIDELPSGSRDPFALRRAALGAIRIILGNSVRLPLSRAAKLGVLQATRSLIEVEQKINMELAGRAFSQMDPDNIDGILRSLSDHLAEIPEGESPETAKSVDSRSERIAKTVDDLLAFFADRLKVMLRDQGKRHDLVDAVFALGDDDLVRIVARVDALDAFLTTEDGANLLAGYKRATNILKAEEKKGELPTGPAVRLPDAPAEELALIDALAKTTPAVNTALDAEDFAAAMRALAGLRAPVDAFFDKVLVNADDVAARSNRLRLLSEVRRAMGRVADFSQISG